MNLSATARIEAQLAGLPDAPWASPRRQALQRELVALQTSIDTGVCHKSYCDVEATEERYGIPLCASHAKADDDMSAWVDRRRAAGQSID